jgi:hypothetical protein
MTKRQLRKWRQRRQRQQDNRTRRNVGRYNTRRQPDSSLDRYSLRIWGAAFRRLALRKSVFFTLPIVVVLLTSCTPF